MDRLNELLSIYKIPLALSLVGLVLIIGGIFSSGLYKSPKSFPKESIVSVSPQAEFIKVDVSGAVKNPAVYELPSESRIEDAIKIAGGFDDQVNIEYVAKRLNLSQKLNDATKLYIPFDDEEGIIKEPDNLAGTSSSAPLIGINTASSTELESLPGIGPVSASKIISGRPFKSLEELVQRKIISKSVFQRIKSSIDIN